LADDQIGNVGHGDGQKSDEEIEKKIDFQKTIDDQKQSEKGYDEDHFFVGGFGSGLDFQKISQNSDEKNISQGQGGNFGEAEMIGDDSREESFGDE